LTYFSFFALLIIAIGSPSNAATLHDADLVWKSIHSEHFIVNYPVELQQRAKQVVLQAEAIHQKLSLYFNWSANEKTEITLTENALSPGAYALARPHNRIQLHLQAEYAARQGYGDFARLLAHEYAHVLHLDKVAGVPAGMRKVFGRLNVFFPNTLQPLWGIEGMASYASDYLVDPISQGESESFQALMRIEVNQGIKPLSQINIPVDEWPFVVTPYLYGEEWLRYLSHTYGEDSLRNLVQNYSNNLVPFLINSNSKSVYEKNLDALYSEFKNYLEQRYGNQIAAIKADKFPTDELLKGQTGNCGSLVEVATMRYFLCNDWQSETKLIQQNIESGKTEVIGKLADAGLLDERDGKLLVIQQDWRHNTINTRDLYAFDVNDGSLLPITHDGFYLFGKWKSDTAQLVALRYFHDRYYLDLLDSNGVLLKHLWQSSDDEKLSVYDVSADGQRVLASVWRHNQYWQLEEFSLQTQQWQRLYSSATSIYGAKYVDGSDDLLFNANFNGVPNIYRLNLAEKTIFQLTNVIGMAGSVRQFNSGIYYTQASREGNKIYKLSDSSGRKIDTRESLPDIASNTFIDPPIEENRFDTRDYSPYPGILPSQVAPRLNSSNKLKTIGFNTYGYDALLHHRYDVRFDHISTIARNEYQFDYRYNRWFPTFDYQLLSELSLFHDNSGSLKSVERANRHTLNVIFPFLKSRSRWAIYSGVKKEDFHAYAEDASVNLQNPPSENTYGIAVLFDSSKSFARSMTLSEGRSMRFQVERSLPDSDYRGTRLQYEWREYFNLGKANVLSSKILAGRVYDNLRSYYLGGEAEPSSMHFMPASMGDVLPPSPFARRGFPFRGYASGIPALTGDRMALWSLDWTFPVARINRGLMAPPAAIRHIAGRLFVERGDAWSTQPHWLTSYGVEMRLAMQLFYRQAATWRFGIVKGNASFSETRLYHYINIPFF